MPTPLTQSLAAAPVRPEFVAGLAPALESPFAVGAALAAIPFLGTFVHICGEQAGQELFFLPSSHPHALAD